MGYDKFKAKNFKWRISEKSIFIIALLLGSIGVYMGMYKFRHKTKHTKFVIGIPIMIVLNLITVFFIFKYI